MSVGDGFISRMAADSTTAISGGAVLPRRRGKSKGPNFKHDGPVSVIRLELDASDPMVRRRLQRQWDAVFRLRRALQHDAADRCRAYWAARHERQRDPKGAARAAGVDAQRY
ncbi:MAG: putative transposase [Mycobacterium sp.]|nr:putative transposase [Mycobacterium sp.]